MPDTPPDPGSAPDPGTAPEAFAPVTSQEEFDRRIGPRLARERETTAAQYAGFAEYKASHEKLMALEDADKTELQKTQDALSAANSRAEAAERSALVTRVALAKGVPAEGLTGTTQAELEASADALLAWRGEQKPPHRVSLEDLKSGSTGNGTGSDPKALAAEAVRRMRRGA